MNDVKTKTPPLRSRIKEATNQEILTAAESVLAEHGVVDMTMAKVAKAAGVAVGTLYNYFADRDQLLRVLHRTRREHFYEVLTKTIEETKGEAFEGRLTKVVQVFVDQYESHRDFMKIIFSGEMPASLCGGRPPLLDFAARLTPLLKDGVKEKVIGNVDLNLYAASLASILRGMIIIRLSEDKPMADVVPFVTQLFLHGAGARR